MGGSKTNLNVVPVNVNVVQSRVGKEVEGVTRAGLEDGQVYELVRGTRYGGLDLAPCHPPAHGSADAHQEREANPSHQWSRRVFWFVTHLPETVSS